MIARAKRAFPGMVLSLLLSAPALATAQTTEKPTQAPHRPQTTGAPSSLKAARTATPRVTLTGSAGKKAALAAKPVQQAVRLPAHPPYVASPRVQPLPAAGTPGRIIHRTSGQTLSHQLIDDGTLWRESGTVTTWQQTGVASWYGGKRWQGHRMSSGARYDENALTAAHATLPIGTKVRVVLLDGRRDVVVTITDRPGTRSRIIDLSRKAAEELGILSRGVAMVTLQPL